MYASDYAFMLQGLHAGVKGTSPFSEREGKLRHSTGHWSNLEHSGAGVHRSFCRPTLHPKCTVAQELAAAVTVSIFEHTTLPASFTVPDNRCAEFAEWRLSAVPLIRTGSEQCYKVDACSGATRLLYRSHTVNSHY